MDASYGPLFNVMTSSAHLRLACRNVAKWFFLISRLNLAARQWVSEQITVSKMGQFGEIISGDRHLAATAFLFECISSLVGRGVPNVKLYSALVHVGWVFVRLYRYCGPFEWYTYLCWSWSDHIHIPPPSMLYRQRASSRLPPMIL